MKVFVKITHGNTHYWNDVEKRWEGLICNATPVSDFTYEALRKEFPLNSYSKELKKNERSPTPAQL